MNDKAIQHTRLEGVPDYIAALDTLCNQARQNLYFFEKDFDGAGFNAEMRYLMLRRFLLASPNRRLYVLAHDMHYLSTQCPRMLMLLRQFGASMFIHQTAPNLQHISEPFSVADDSSYVRRFHFEDPRGIFAQNDPEIARTLKSRFMEMWATSHQGISSTTLGL